MAILIDNFHVGHFRGINDLHVNHLNHFNLFVGDNNSGKTSVLEALLLLRNPAELSNAVRVARQRENTISGVSLFDNFMFMFPQQNTDPYEIEVSATYKNNPLQCRIAGRKERILLDSQDLLEYVEKKERIRHSLDLETETDAFRGIIHGAIMGKEKETPVDINFYTRATGMNISSRGELRMVYLSPLDHLNNNILNQIIKNDEYKALCLRIIQMFDPQIEDMLLLKSNVAIRVVEYLKHKEHGLMPISTYGDGIKKVLAIANAIAKCANGILLIDEIETAIHAKYYNDIFLFLIKACKAFNVQVFITTHSIEAVDALLATQNYDAQQTDDDINIVTLKKEGAKSYSRVLTGREVQSNREAFDFEVRL